MWNMSISVFLSKNTGQTCTTYSFHITKVKNEKFMKMKNKKLRSSFPCTYNLADVAMFEKSDKEQFYDNLSMSLCDRPVISAMASISIPARSIFLAIRFALSA